jgi:hypothetical protein
VKLDISGDVTRDVLTFDCRALILYPVKLTSHNVKFKFNLRSILLVILHNSDNNICCGLSTIHPSGNALQTSPYIKV